MRAHSAVARLIGCVCVLSIGASPARAQISHQEFWPELNVFVKTSEQTRLMFLASRSRDREYAKAVDGTTGLHFDVFTQRLPSWWLTALPSMEQHWGMWFRFGYNHVVAFDGPGANENRLFAETTLRSQPLLAGVQIANRSRMEARDISDHWSWRYRNRTRIERTFESVAVFGDTVGESLRDIGLVQLSPYVMLEFFYDSRVSGWSRRYLQAGIELEFARGWGLDVYMAAQDGLNGSTASVNALGVVLTLRD